MYINSLQTYWRCKSRAAKFLTPFLNRIQPPTRTSQLETHPIHPGLFDGILRALLPASVADGNHVVLAGQSRRWVTWHMLWMCQQVKRFINQIGRLCINVLIHWHVYLHVWHVYVTIYIYIQMHNILCSIWQHLCVCTKKNPKIQHHSSQQPAQVNGIYQLINSKTL